jgi:hypothetical protein
MRGANAIFALAHAAIPLAICLNLRNPVPAKYTIRPSVRDFGGYLGLYGRYEATSGSSLLQTSLSRQRQDKPGFPCMRMRGGSSGDLSEASILKTKGNSEFREGNFAEAKELYEQALSALPEEAESHKVQRQ